MRMSRAATHSMVMALVLAPWVLSAQAEHRNYDLKKEVLISGVIAAIRQHPSGPEMVSIVVKKGDVDAEIVLAPKAILQKHDYQVRVGDAVTALCAPENGYFKSRRVSIRESVLEILNSDGSPVDSPDGGRKSTKNTYDVSKEVRIVGKIKEIRKSSIGAGHITNLVVSDGGNPKEIFLGPDFIFKKSPIPMAPGDGVEIFCSPEKSGYRARQLRMGGQIFDILDEKGRPIHSPE